MALVLNPKNEACRAPPTNSRPEARRFHWVLRRRCESVPAILVATGHQLDENKKSTIIPLTGHHLDEKKRPPSSQQPFSLASALLPHLSMEHCPPGAARRQLALPGTPIATAGNLGVPARPKWPSGGFTLAPSMSPTQNDIHDQRVATTNACSHMHRSWICGTHVTARRRSKKRSTQPRA